MWLHRAILPLILLSTVPMCGAGPLVPGTYVSPQELEGSIRLTGNNWINRHSDTVTIWGNGEVRREFISVAPRDTLVSHATIDTYRAVELINYLIWAQLHALPDTISFETPSVGSVLLNSGQYVVGRRTIEDAARYDISLVAGGHRTSVHLQGWSPAAPYALIQAVKQWAQLRNELWPTGEPD